jgi:uncharacterized membrane protein YagU involved in acid resistance
MRQGQHRPVARQSLLGALGRGLIAGATGTAVMTAYQLAVAKAQGKPLETPVPRTWADAPPPAQVVKKTADAIGKGRKITKNDVPLVTNAMHWTYGIAWGLAYGLAARKLRPSPVKGAAALGTGVWASAYAELVPLGIYKPPWEYPAQDLGLDLSYHLVYGAGVAAAYAALEP